MESTYMKSIPERWGLACRWIPSILIFCFLFLVSCQVEERNSALGEFRVNLTASGETDVVSKSDAGDSVIPDADEFQILIKSKDGTVNEPYERFADLLANLPLTLPSGEYEFSANYSRRGEEGFSVPTLGGSKSFTILKGQTTDIDVTCTLTSTKVTVNLTNEFMNYFPEHFVGIKSAKQKIFYFDEETIDQDLYLQPGELYMEVVGIKQNGTSGTFYPLSLTDTKAAQHYVINLTVNNGEVGGEKLIITFDDGFEEQEVEIDLSDEAMSEKEPFFTPTGFTSGGVIEIAEGTDLGELSVLITARGSFQTCILKTESAYLASQGWEPAIDLIGISTFDENVLKKFGLDWTPGLTTANTNKDLKMSVLDFSGLIPLLRTYEGENKHVLTLVVTDQQGKKSEELQLIVHTLEANFVLHAPEPVTIGSSSAYFTVDLDGNINQIVIQSKNNYGVWLNAKTTPVSSEGNRHVVLAEELPVEDKPLQIRAVYNTIESNEQTLEVTIPTFEIQIADEADIWASKVYLTIVPEKESDMEGIKKYLMVSVNNQLVPVSFDGDKAVVSGLTPGAPFTFRGTCDGVEYSNEVSVTTESALMLPNGDFEEGWDIIYYNEKMQQGGGFKGLITSTRYLYQEVTAANPIGWTTVNLKTTPTSARNQNTWYIVPCAQETTDSYFNTAIKLRNVAWDNNGPDISVYSAMTTPSYCQNVPSSIANRSAGKLFLGDYSYDHDSNDEIYNEGIDFTSRPTSITGYYKYTDLGNDGGGTVSITVENRDGNNVTVLGVGTAVLSGIDSYTLFNVPITYEIKDKKATHLKVMFTSSTKSSYNQAEETANITTINRNSTTEAVSTGSELYLDNIQLNYE